MVAERFHVARKGFGTDDAFARAIGSLEDLERLVLLERHHAVTDGHHHVAGGKDADDAIGLADIAIFDPRASGIHSGDDRAGIRRRSSPWRLVPRRQSAQLNGTPDGSRIGGEQPLVVGLYLG